MTSSSNVRAVVARYLALAPLLALGACGKAVSSQAPAYEEPGAVSLALAGYNYTNRYIDTYTIDGVGGGNLYVSSPNGGGGGTTCCIRYWPGTKTFKVKVRWQSGACYFRVKASDSDETYDDLHSFFKEAEVTVEDRAGERGRYIETHFYPDGTVQVAATAEPSPPRLSLSKQREDKSRYPRCPNDERPRQ